jgi:hypothetical protein
MIQSENTPFNEYVRNLLEELDVQIEQMAQQGQLLNLKGQQPLFVQFLLKLVLQQGGTGFYEARDFVHLDVGDPARTWYDSNAKHNIVIKAKFC